MRRASTSNVTVCPEATFTLKKSLASASARPVTTAGMVGGWAVAVGTSTDATRARPAAKAANATTRERQRDMRDLGGVRARGDACDDTAAGRGRRGVLAVD